MTFALPSKRRSGSPKRVVVKIQRKSDSEHVTEAARVREQIRIFQNQASITPNIRATSVHVGAEAAPFL